MRVRGKKETRRLNRMLQSHGLGTLDDRGTISQLAFLVRDHDHLRQLLVTCEPDERRNMYEAVRPYLRFPARPLDAYLAEAAMQADKLKLPAWDEENKRFIPYRDYDADKLKQTVNQAIGDEMAREAAQGRVLIVTCSKCTKQAEFTGTTVVDATIKARHAGWVYDRMTEKEICPECPAARPWKEN